MANRNRNKPAPKRRFPLAIAALFALIVIAIVVLLVRHFTKQSFEADTQGFIADEPAQQEDFVWNGEDGDSAVVAQYEGGEIGYDDVLPVYNRMMQQRTFGEAPETETVARDAITAVVTDRILREKAKELGLSVPEETINAMVAERLAEQTAYYEETAEPDEDVQALMEEDGVTEQNIREQVESEQLQLALYDHIEQNLVLTDEDCTAAYEALVAAQQQEFDASAEAFAFAANHGETIAYMPQGFRTVRQLQLSFADDASSQSAYEIFAAIAQLNPADDYDAIMEYNDQLAVLYADLDAKANALIERLNAGESFDALLAEAGEDESMRSGALAQRGYIVCAGLSEPFSEEFVEGAMALERPGQYTPVSMRSAEGVHIILYVADAQPGPVGLDAVRAEIEASVREEKAAAAYDAQIEEWIAQANIVIHTEAF